LVVGQFGFAQAALRFLTVGSSWHDPGKRQEAA